MIIAKSLLRDICSNLGPYCTNFIGAKWSVFSDMVTYNYAGALKIIFQGIRNDRKSKEEYRKK